MDIAFFILLNLLSISMGMTEAILYSGKASRAFKWNEHSVFMVNRILCAACILVSPFVEDRVLIMTACVFMFPFVHDSGYLITRSKIDVPGYKYYSDSADSSATLEIKFKYRVVFLLIGIGILLVPWRCIY